MTDSPDFALPHQLLERARVSADGALEWRRSDAIDVVDALAVAGQTLLRVEGRAYDSVGRVARFWQAGRNQRLQRDAEYVRQWAAQAVARESWAEWIRLYWTESQQPPEAGVREPRRPRPGAGSAQAQAAPPEIGGTSAVRSA